MNNKNYTLITRSNSNPSPLDRLVSMHYTSAYNLRKQQNWLHLFIFYGFGLFFGCCALSIYFKNPNPIYGAYFHNSDIIKNCVNVLCALFSLFSFGVALAIKPEKEAFSHLASRIDHELGQRICPAQLKLSRIIQKKLLKRL